MNTLGSRIAHFRRLTGLSQGQLASLCGWKSQSRVGNYEKDLREPTLADLELIASALRVSVAQLTYGDTAATEHSNVAPAIQPYRPPRQYPVLSSVPAGDPRESVAYLPEHAEEHYPSTENAGPYGYWLRVEGPSMTSSSHPSFPHGTLILVQPEGFDLISGKYYIARHRDATSTFKATFKKYINDCGREYLAPLNPEFETIRMDHDWDIIGRVIDIRISDL